MHHAARPVRQVLAGVVAGALSCALACPPRLARADDGEDPFRAPGPGAPRIHLRVEGSGSVALYRVLADVNRARRTVTTISRECRAPCGRVIDGRAGHSFFIGGDSVTSSPRFELIGESGDLVANVRPGRPGMHLAGWIFGLLGASSLLLGAALTGAALARGREDRLPLGGGLLAGGVVGLGIGIPLWLIGRTRVRWHRGKSRRRAR